MPKVSIVVPVYNVEDYMRKTIDVLCRQTLEDIEIILVDDGSTDASGKICDELACADSRIKVIHSKPKVVCAARNTGIDAADGDFIGFCDSDDMPGIDLYETLFNLITVNKTDMAMVQSLVVYEDGSTFTTAENKGLFKWNDNQELIKEFLKGRFGTAVYKILFKKSLAKSIRFEEGRKINEDKMYVFEAMNKVKTACYLDECKYRYFRRNGSASFAKFSEKFFDGIYFAEKIDSIVRKKYPSISCFSKAALATTHLWTLKLMYLENGEENYKKEWKNSVKFLRSLNMSFCKKYLKKNDFIKWLSLKAGVPMFKIATSLFSKN